MISISKFTGKARVGIHSQPGTLRTVIITVICVVAFFYVIGILTGAPLASEPANDGDTITEQEPEITDASPVAALHEPAVNPGEASVMEPTLISAEIYYGDLELPVNGATGYAAVGMNMTATTGLPIEIVNELQPGTAFLILEEQGDRWKILVDGVTGWVRHSQCMINLPDVIPSIKYNITNTYDSLFVSGGKSIPGVTGEALYQGRTYNARLDSEEFIVPVMYSMARRICQAQRNALTNNESLVIYEAFRPYSVQRSVAEALDKLSKEDRDVRTGINTWPWNLNWFISTTVSNHQLGGAMDVGLAKIAQDGFAVAGPYQYLRVAEYSDYEMPTPMHELSLASVTYTTAVRSDSLTDWKKASFSPGMESNRAARRLQKYCTDAGLTPLASEWWHFNDPDTLENSPDGTTGDFILTECYSVFPIKPTAVIYE